MRLASLILCGLLVGLPSSGISYPGGRQASAAAVEEAGRRLDVPYVAQVQEGCGSASLAMLLAYWQERGHAFPKEMLDAAHIHRKIYSAKDHGSRAEDVEAYLHSVGMRTFALRGRWSDLEEHVGNGRPMLVALRAPGGRQLHYAVVTGVSDSHVLLNDPAIRPNALWSRRDFERRWKASGNWTLLALPAQ